MTKWNEIANAAMRGHFQGFLVHIVLLMSIAVLFHVAANTYYYPGPLALIQCGRDGPYLYLQARRIDGQAVRPSCGTDMFVVTMYDQCYNGSHFWGLRSKQMSARTPCAEPQHLIQNTPENRPALIYFKRHYQIYSSNGEHSLAEEVVK